MRLFPRLRLGRGVIVFLILNEVRGVVFWPAAWIAVLSQSVAISNGWNAMQGSLWRAWLHLLVALAHHWGLH